MKEVTLPSGVILQIGVSPFAVSKALYQAVLREAKGVTIGTQTEMTSLYKDLFCVGFSSPDIEKCLNECFKKCIYGELKIDADTFEPVSAREDYMSVCVEVAKENIAPFMKNLFAEYQRILAMMPSTPA